MVSDKAGEYKDLVSLRKNCTVCQSLVNPACHSEYDSDEIGPWSIWQGNIDADIMVVGQDWGNVDYFISRLSAARIQNSGFRIQNI